MILHNKVYWRLAAYEAQSELACSIETYDEFLFMHMVRVMGIGRLFLRFACMRVNALKRLITAGDPQSKKLYIFRNSEFVTYREHALHI